MEKVDKKKEGDISYKKGKQAYENHNWEEAAEYLEEAVKLTPDKYSYYYYAQALGKLGKHEKAIETLSQAYNYLPKDKETKEHVVILQVLASEARCSGNFNLSMKYLEQALDIGKRIFTEYNLLTLKSEIDDEKRQIKDDEKKLLAKQADDLLKTADELEKKKAYPEAVEEYSKVLENHHEILIVYLKRGKCYYFMQKYQEAITDFNIYEEKSVLKPENSITDMQFHRGICYAELEQYDKAFTEWKKLYDRVRLDPKYKKLTTDLIQIYNATKEKVKCKESVKEKSVQKELRKPEEIAEEYKIVKEILQDTKFLNVFFEWILFF